LGCAPERAKFLRWLVFIVANIYPTFTYADDPSRFVARNVAHFLAAIKIEVIPGPIDCQERTVDEQPLPPQIQRPQKWHAFEEAKKQRWIAQRTSIAIDIDEWSTVNALEV
jgi:hypothetical protein